MAYNGIQDRSRASAASADIANSSKKASLSLAETGLLVNTPDFAVGGSSALTVSSGTYRIFTLCASTSTTEYAVAAELNNGDIYYSKNGSAPVKTTSVSSTAPCTSLSIVAPVNMYANIPSTTKVNFMQKHSKLHQSHAITPILVTHQLAIKSGVTFLHINNTRLVINKSYS